jgi:dUTP pyrophosphatase
VTVYFKTLRPGIKPPAYATHGASGMDLAADIPDPVTLPPGGRGSFPTGIAVEIPEGYEGQVRPRSGLARKFGVATFFGTIDADYRGEIGVTLVNHGSEAVVIGPGDRIAQLVVAPVVRAELLEVAELTETVRGIQGFGSTGK